MVNHMIPQEQIIRRDFGGIWPCVRWFGGRGKFQEMDVCTAQDPGEKLKQFYKWVTLINFIKEEREMKQGKDMAGVLGEGHIFIFVVLRVTIFCLCPDKILEWSLYLITEWSYFMLDSRDLLPCHRNQNTCDLRAFSDILCLCLPRVVFHQQPPSKADFPWYCHLHSWVSGARDASCQGSSSALTLSH